MMQRQDDDEVIPRKVKLKLITEHKSGEDKLARSYELTCSQRGKGQQGRGSERDREKHVRVQTQMRVLPSSSKVNVPSRRMREKGPEIGISLSLNKRKRAYISTAE